MMLQLDPSATRATTLEQVVALIRQNSALEVRLATYADANSLQQRLQESHNVHTYILFSQQNEAHLQLFLICFVDETDS